MGRRSRIHLALFLVLLACFGAGVVHLFHLRFEGGDVYPPYSSFRADPLGTRALYESLDRLEQVSCRRNLTPLKKLGQGEGRTLWILGVEPWDLLYEEADTLRSLEGFMATGGRLVISLRPLLGDRPSLLRDSLEETSPKEEEPEEDGAEDEGAEDDKAGTQQKETDAETAGQETEEGDEAGETEDESDSEKKERELKEEERRRKLRRLMEGRYGRSFENSIVSLRERWGFSYHTGSLADLGLSPEEGTVVSLQAGQTGLDSTLPWHSTLTFTDLKDDWRTVYAREELPVLIERPFGEGSLVFVGDSFLLSNQALRDERHPNLISWLVGPANRIVFEETYHGSRENPNIATLARRYGLQWVEAGLLLTAGLFLWHQLSSFLPKMDDEARLLEKRTAQGRDQASGLVHLLKRSVPSSQLVDVCVQEWKKSLPHGSKAAKEDAARAENIVQTEMSRPSKERDPVSAYRAIANALKERK